MSGSICERQWPIVTGMPSPNAKSVISMVAAFLAPAFRFILVFICVLLTGANKARRVPSGWIVPALNIILLDRAPNAASVRVVTSGGADAADRQPLFDSDAACATAAERNYNAARSIEVTAPYTILALKPCPLRLKLVWKPESNPRENPWTRGSVKW